MVDEHCKGKGYGFDKGDMSESRHDYFTEYIVHVSCSGDRGLRKSRESHELFFFFLPNVAKRETAENKVWT